MLRSFLPLSSRLVSWWQVDPLSSWSLLLAAFAGLQLLLSPTRFLLPCDGVPQKNEQQTPRTRSKEERGTPSQERTTSKRKVHANCNVAPSMRNSRNLLLVVTIPTGLRAYGPLATPPFLFCSFFSFLCVALPRLFRASCIFLLCTSRDSL